MTSAQIQYELKRKGVSQKDIAKRCDVSATTISKVINHSMISHRIMKAIANAIDKDYKSVFSDYYENSV
ncbi:Helix-turn-helix type 3 domain protein [Candidatus Magnetomorum sp. HK-1]|nr:Helix-turn-helix type 3 domain protein [Candidatus Magnetomorum sp. HK-1]